MKIIEFHMRINKIMKIIKFNLRFMKIMKIIEFHLRIMKIMTIIESNLKIEKQYKNHTILHEHHENPNKILKVHARVTKILKPRIPLENYKIVEFNLRIIKIIKFIEFHMRITELIKVIQFHIKKNTIH